MPDSIIAVVPARMGSTRFPGKPLEPILGLPMVEHVRRRTEMCDGLDATLVATCDEEIYKEVEASGGRAMMTSDEHVRASDRVAEVARETDHDVYVMVQGDEPMVRPEMIASSLEPFEGGADVDCVNLTHPITDEADFEDPNTIKVVTDLDGNAVYMSREPVPTRTRQDFEALTTLKQVCIIPFTRESLLRFADLEPTPLERAESIDMLRFIEHGYTVRMVETPHETYPVDTPEDRDEVEERMRDDPLLDRYMEDPPEAGRS